jgi:predicted nucleic acid-binding Zn ribbon protein
MTTYICPNCGHKKTIIENIGCDPQCTGLIDPHCPYCGVRMERKLEGV